MDTSHAQLVYLDELEKRLSELLQMIKPLDDAIKNASSDVSKSVMIVSDVVKSRKYPKPESVAPIIDAIQKSIVSNSNIQRLSNQDLIELSQKLDTLIMYQSEISDKLSELMKPKEWDYKIHRDNLRGHIVSVTATPKNK